MQLPTRLLLVLVFANLGSACGGDKSDDSTSTGSTGAPTGSTTTALDVTATWSGAWLSQTGNGGALDATLIQDVDAVTGTITMADSPCFQTLNVAGTLTGTDLSLTATDAMGVELQLASTAGELTIDGTYEVIAGGPCTGDTGTFDLTR